MAGVCAHCGLRVGRRAPVATVDGVAAAFCCWGCILALQVTRARGERGAAAAVLVRLGLALFFAMNVMMLSMPPYAAYLYGTAAGDGPLFVVLRVLAGAFAAPVLVLLGGPIAVSAWRGRALNADALVLLGTLAAYELSVANLVHGRDGVYFETAAMLLVLVTLGRWLEASARAEAGAAVRATLAPAPARATRLRDGMCETLAPGRLAPGDVVLVTAGEAFPTDGVVIAGVGGVDEAALTGESLPVVKEPGGTVAGGTVSVDGLFRMRVTAPASASATARIAALLDAARRERTAAERTADRVARWLVPVVVGVTLAAGAWWTVHASLERGILVGLATLVVACPCALGIATPVAVWNGLASAARRGVIVRSAPVLERLADVAHVLFDKTGTLTGRTPALVAIEPAPGGSPGDLLMRAAALEAGLTHPLARGIVSAARARDLAWPQATDVRAVPGRGVRGRVEGRACAAGSVRFAEEELGRSLGVPTDQAATTVAVLTDGVLLGTLRFREAPRPGAATAVAAVRGLGVHPGLLSGDTHAAALVPGIIAPSEATLGLLPEGKVARIRALARSSRGAVAMVGDGINDAPALAAADVGIAVASATDLARLAADVVIVSDDLASVPWLVAHARRVVRVARQNLAWAFAYNAGAVALAAAGVLTPLVASLAMLGSSLAVVANARRIGRSAAHGAAPQAEAARLPAIGAAARPARAPG